ncbi:hypothetical protein LZC95_36895 [Pendulispora brunnea]|uniref:DUF3618 domain-containing protein n=1 Tax=Pendulispora brunnea TaxID=2905690 RepID=A0ABZ2K474_9BACT
MTLQIDRHTELQQQAEIARTRLFETLDVLDRRRHSVVRMGHQAKTVVAPVGLAVAGLLVVGITATAVRQHRALERARHDWRRALVQRLVPEAPPQGFFSEAGRRVGLALLLLAANEFGKRLLRAL